VTSPNLELERKLLERYDRVICLDEVGRGSLAGPVAVGASVITQETENSIPKGLKDSKLIPESKRDSIAELSKDWVEHNVGFATSNFIESDGISKALAEAAVAAFEPLVKNKTVILLDGSQNWLKGIDIEVVMQVKADRDCAGVSAAALIAKVSRDQLMRDYHLEYPLYGWDANKGYASGAHIKAIQLLGPTHHHRLSWLTKILSQDQSLF
jgi:ribonuclease HII